MKRQGSIWLIPLTALLIVGVNAWAADESKWPFCVGGVAFDVPQNMIGTSAVSYAEGAVEQLAAIERMDSSSFKANLYYGPASSSPYVPPENIPSTKIDLGSMVASMSCITSPDGLKSCHIAYDIADNSEKIIVFSYSDLSWDDSMIADSIWKSAHLDEDCKNQAIDEAILLHELHSQKPITPTVSYPCKSSVTISLCFVRTSFSP